MRSSPSVTACPTRAGLCQDVGKLGIPVVVHDRILSLAKTLSQGVITPSGNSNGVAPFRIPGGPPLWPRWREPAQLAWGRHGRGPAACDSLRARADLLRRSAGLNEISWFSAAM